MTDRILESLGGRAAVLKAIESNLKWLERSFSCNNYLGSSAYANVFGRWGKPYPETTGYLVPTLIECSGLLRTDKWSKLALGQGNYFKKIQNSEGWFVASHEKRPLVFDNAQILLGLLPLVHEVEKSSLPDLRKCYFRILGALDTEGVFFTNNYIENYNPSYYARIVWALLLAEKTFGLEPEKKTRTLYHRIATLQNNNLSFRDCAFAPGEPIFTHTIIYTIRGLWESAVLLEDEEMTVKMEQSVEHLDALITQNNTVFAGAFDSDWSGDYRFICTVGNCQLAVLKLLMYERSGRKKGLNNVAELLIPVIKSQRKAGFNMGACPSSLPIYGAYQRFKYTNWTQKFYLDSLLALMKSASTSSG